MFKRQCSYPRVGRFWLLSLLITMIFASHSIAQPPASQATPVLMVLGDSLSAGYGLQAGEGWVNLLREKLAKTDSHIQLVNQSISGETSAGGLARLTALLKKYQPQWLLIQLGANDGLRAMPPAKLKANLQQMIRQARAAGAQPLLLGIKLPPNYGPAYTQLFERVYDQVAAESKVPLLEFFLDGVAGNAALMQADGLHPNAAAQPKLLKNVWEFLAPKIIRVKVPKR